MSQAIERVLSESVLDQTMRLFWAKGYAQTPIDEIVAVTGFNRAAIYSRFGGKRGLFLAMLARYRERITDRLLEPLRNVDDGLAAIEAFLKRLSTLPELTEQSMGCLLVTTASDRAALDEAASRIVSDYLQELTRLIREALYRARTQSRLPADMNLEAMADFLTGNVLGLMTLTRSPAPAGAFHNQIGVLRHYLRSLEKT